MFYTILLFCLFFVVKCFDAGGILCSITDVDKCESTFYDKDGNIIDHEDFSDTDGTTEIVGDKQDIGIEDAAMDAEDEGNEGETLEVRNEEYDYEDSDGAGVKECSSHNYSFWFAETKKC